MLVIDLVGDIQIDKKDSKTNRLYFLPHASTSITGIQGNFGSDAWWIPIYINAGIKIMTRIRHPRRFARECRSKTYKEVAALADWVRKNWTEYSGKVVRGRKYLPAIYDYCVIRHSGHYEYGQAKKRASGIDYGTYYPAWIMQSYKTPAFITDHEREDYKQCFTNDNLPYALECLKHGAAWGRDTNGQLIRFDIDNEEKAKCA